MRWHLLLAICLCGTTGCGGGPVPTYPVEGKVTFPDGKPLWGGSVEFQPIGDNQPPELRVSARGQIQEDGTFTLSTFEPGDGVIAGEHQALVIQPLPPGPINAYNPSPPVINDRFQRYETSGLKFTVTPDGPNKFDITVTRPGQ